MKKICVVTGTRAEYGLLYWVLKEIQSKESLDLQLIVTGMHLSPEFGLTYKEIEREFSINKKIEILLSSDSSIGVSKSMGLAQISFAEAYSELNPDIVVLLGDRFEIFSAASAAMISRIPIAHIHGGETTEGAFDEAIRHAISKMSHIHFVATEQYRKRVIQLGESPGKVFNVGAPGLDNIDKLNLLSRSELEGEIDFKFGAKNLLVTFHPVTLEDNTSEQQFGEILAAIDVLKNTKIIFTYANSDTNGRAINAMIESYVSQHSDKARAYRSLGQLRFLSCLKNCDAIVGNSSSGIIEAPSLCIPSINIGDRQKGRVRADSVVDCAPKKNEVIDAIKRIYTKDFSTTVKTMVNPYGAGGASQKIVDTLEDVQLGDILKKKFYDFPITS